MKEIYLDNNATTPPLPEVISAMSEAMSDVFGNPSSPNRRGNVARKLLTESRSSIEQLVGARISQLIFTSGGTEANNLVLQGALKGPIHNRLITISTEHSSVLNTACALKERSTSVSIIPVDSNGRVSLGDIEKALAVTTGMVSVQWANSETGVIQPVFEIGEICRKFGVLFHVDAAQAIGRIPIVLEDLPIDFLTFSAHKIHGPQGVGAVCVSRNRKTLHPIMFGGDQEFGIRAGTENLPGIAGFGVAAQIRERSLNSTISQMERMRNRFENQIVSALPNVVINGDIDNRVVNTTNLYFPEVDGTAMMARLDAAGVVCSQTSACTSHRPEPSHVLKAMGLSEDEAFGSLRFSFSMLNSKTDAETGAHHVCESYNALRSLQFTY